MRRLVAGAAFTGLAIAPGTVRAQPLAPIALTTAVVPSVAQGQALANAVAQASAPIVVPNSSGAAWTPAEIAKLRGELDRLLARSPALRGAHVGAYVVDTGSGATLYAHAADDAFQPASTLKLLVGSVALERLGAGYRFRTVAVVRNGRLVVRASGDPTLAKSDLASLHDALPAVTGFAPGDVVVDDAHFDRVPYPAGWTWDDFGYDYAAPVSAATIDENVASFTVVAGAKSGDDVSLAEGDGNSHVLLDCDSVTAGVRSVATTAPAGSASTIDTRTIAPGCTEINGTLAVGKTESVEVAVRDPAAHFAQVVRAALSSTGRPMVARDATGLGAGPASAPGTGPAPGPGTASASASGGDRAESAGVAAWTHDSPELRAWLGPRFWIPSDNLFGELLLKEIGFASAGAPGTTDKGIVAEKLWLRSIGADLTNVTLADGCGMSAYDRLTPRVLVGILQHDWNAPNRELILDSLPVGGSRGTIEGMAGTAAAGRVFAKTGSMMHVRGLAGYLAPRRHGAVTFAFNVDDWNGNDAALAAVRAQFASQIVAD